MRIALRELRRRPGNFVLATVILTLLALLLMFLGSLLDGLLSSSTGAYRAQPGDLIVTSSISRKSLIRSRLTADQRRVIESTEHVSDVGGLGSVQLGARPASKPKTRDLISTVLFGYELAPRGLPAKTPASGKVIADSSLRAQGIKHGSTLLLGPQRTPVEVIGFVDDTQYLGESSLWGSLETWRKVSSANRPGQGIEDTVQAFVVKTKGSTPADVAADIDRATKGQTTSQTKAAAVEGLPGVAQQRATFTQIIGVTVLVALVVVALFFALITVERTALYGILKAIGASSGNLFAGLLTQALVVTLLASAIGVAVTLAIAAAIPAGSIPFDPTPTRLGSSVLLMVIAAIAGCAFSLRRVLRIDPASAIGTAP